MNTRSILILLIFLLAITTSLIFFYKNTGQVSTDDEYLEKKVTAFITGAYKTDGSIYIEINPFDLIEGNEKTKICYEEILDDKEYTLTVAERVDIESKIKQLEAPSDLANLHEERPAEPWYETRCSHPGFRIKNSAHRSERFGLADGALISYIAYDDEGMQREVRVDSETFFQIFN